MNGEEHYRPTHLLETKLMEASESDVEPTIHQGLEPIMQFGQVLVNSFPAFDWDHLHNPTTTFRHPRCSLSRCSWTFQNGIQAWQNHRRSIAVVNTAIKSSKIQVESCIYYHRVHLRQVRSHSRAICQNEALLIHRITILSFPPIPPILSSLLSPLL